MILTYLYPKYDTSKGPSKELESLFDDVIAITADPDTQEEQVPFIEDMIKKRGAGVLKEQGIWPRDFNEFFLYTPDLRNLGEVIGRNKMNSGMVTPEGEVMMGDTRVRLSRAVRMPYDGDPEVLVVAPHYEEDFGMIMSRLHKEAGHSIYVLFCTLPPEGKEERSLEIYRDVLGLSENEYGFVEINDLGVHKNKEMLKAKLKYTMEALRPRNIILPSNGGNFDHKHVLEAAIQVFNGSGANIILARSVQSLGLKPGEPFNPKLWHVVDSGYADRLVSDLYSNEGVPDEEMFGSRKYVTQVRNLFSQLPEPLIRYLAGLRDSGEEIDFCAYGLEPFSMSHEYAIAHKTRILG